MCVCTFFFFFLLLICLSHCTICRQCSRSPERGLWLHVAAIGSKMLLVWAAWWYVGIELNLQVLKSRMWVDLLNYRVYFIMRWIAMFMQPCKGWKYIYLPVLLILMFKRETVLIHLTWPLCVDWACTHRCKQKGVYTVDCSRLLGFELSTLKGKKGKREERILLWNRLNKSGKANSGQQRRQSLQHKHSSASASWIFHQE